MPDRTIDVPSIKIVLHEHHAGSLFENQRFWRETSLFERFDELLTPLSRHIIEEDISGDSIESVSVVGVNGHIASKELRVILSLYRNIATREELS